MFLGIDLGTSSVKVLLIDEDQNFVASADGALEVLRPNSGWSEQDPHSWIKATKKAIASLSKGNDLSSIKGIGLSGQMHGATLLNKSDEVLRNCVLWNDTRSFAQAEALDSQKQFQEINGNIVFPGFTAPKLAWVKDNEPKTFEQIAKVLLPKDFLRLWLTGNHVSEMSDAAGTSWLDTKNRDWSDDLLKATHLDRSHMPDLVEGNQVSGQLRQTIAQELGLPEGIPVAGGAGDNAASAIGLGVVRAGEAFISIGTSGVLFAANDEYAPAPQTALHTFCHALPDRWHQMGVILSAADSLSWFAKLVGSTPKALTENLGQLQAPGRTLFLPYLGGERTPHNDANVRGAFIGLEHATDQASATCALLEGVAFAFCDCLAAMKSTGTDITQLTCVGGGANSEYWLKIISTALNIPIAIPTNGDFGAAFGAARLGLMAANNGGLEVATSPKIETTIEPELGLTAQFDVAYSNYKAAYANLKEL